MAKCQVLFLELRKISKLAGDEVEVSWTMELLRNMTEAAFGWILDNEDSSAPQEDKICAQQSNPTEKQVCAP